jgi:hypothetical protein
MQVTLPPPIYDHPYDGVVVERVLPLDEARRFCAAIGVGPADGCSGIVTMTDESKRCLIVLPTDGPDPDIENYRRHELAHCNGWPADHRE